MSPLRSPLKLLPLPQRDRSNIPADAAVQLDWSFIRRVAWEHKLELTLAQLTALAATLLHLPVLVDEVLLGKHGPVVSTIDAFPPAGMGRCCTSAPC